MRQIEIDSAQAGQRLDKFLRKYLREATGGFIYKMLRKKNITLNAGRADGSEKINDGDTVSLFFSEETLAKLCGEAASDAVSGGLAAQARKAYETFGRLPVLYEDEHVLLVDKPAGMLSQKAAPCDLSLNEWMTGYLLDTGSVDEEALRLFHPSVCNRLDRNTSGIVICGKTLPGSREMSRVLKDRSVHKYYLLYVEGQMRGEMRIEGFVTKDGSSNTVTVTYRPRPGGAQALTVCRPVEIGKRETLVEAELITGKTHQIRAHLASAGFPLVGDFKYGDRAQNERRKRMYGIEHQLLHSYKIVFPALCGELAPLSGREVTAPLPALFQRFRDKKGEGDR